MASEHQFLKIPKISVVKDARPVNTNPFFLPVFTSLIFLANSLSVFSLMTGVGGGVILQTPDLCRHLIKNLSPYIFYRKEARRKEVFLSCYCSLPLPLCCHRCI